MRRVLVVLVTFILVCPPASAAFAQPTLRISLSEPANLNGWHRQPVSASIAVAGVARVDRCRWSSSFDDASGKTASYRAGRSESVPATKCRVSMKVSKPGSGEITLRASSGSSTEEGSVPIRYDDGAPRVTLTANAGPAQRAPQHLEGIVSDDYAGPDSVSLHFVEVAGLAPAFDARATCSGCSFFHECSASCGFSTAWIYAGNVPAGTWTVTATAADLAGNKAVSPPLNFVSLAA